MQLKENDQVKVIDEDFEATVKLVKGDSVIIECEDGFEYTYEIYKLIKIKSDGDSEHIVKPISFETANSSKPSNLANQVALKGIKPEIDLHIEELCPNEKFRTNHEALVFQLNYCRKVIETAIRNRKRNLVFIHGLGAGKLKQELRNMLNETYPTIEFFDASYQTYGAGATEIIIHKLNKL